MRTPESAPPATLDNSRSYRLSSSRTGEVYRIDVALPFASPQAAPPQQDRGRATPPPVVYVLDGNGMFAMAAQAARLMQLDQNLPPLLIVGIGYDTASFETVLARRRHDLTPVPGRLPTEELGAGGGADDFLAFIREEVQPHVATQFDVDAQDSTLVGDSLGGLFALHALFTAPSSFTRYVAGSPSLWWGNGVAFREEAECAERGAGPRARLFMSVGALEEHPTAEHLRPFAMVSNLERLAGILRARSYPNLAFETVVFPSETHTSVVPATISRGLRSVFANGV